MHGRSCLDDGSGACLFASDVVVLVSLDWIILGSLDGMIRGSFDGMVLGSLPGFFECKTCNAVVPSRRGLFFITVEPNIGSE